MFCYIVYDIVLKLCWSCLWCLMISAQSQSSALGCHLTIRNYTFDYKYSQDGDIILGGIFTVHSWSVRWRTESTISLNILCILPEFSEYRHLLAFIFAINDINNDPDILPNTTLGYHLYDSCGDVNKVIKDVLQIMSGLSVTAPNYSCMDRGTVAGFIGDLRSTTTLPMAQLLGMYGYTQVSYGVRDSLLSDRRLYPHFFRMVGDNKVQYAALVKLLLYFKWNMVCIFATKDDTGEREFRLLSKELTKSGICIELVFYFTQQTIDSSVMRNLKAKVVILCGTNSALVKGILDLSAQSLINKTLILLTSWAHDSILAFDDFTNCSLMFGPVKSTLNGFQDWFLSFHPSTHPHDPILEDLWITSMHCVSNNYLKNFLLKLFIPFPLHNCSGEERLTNRTHHFVDGIPYKVYTAVKIMAQALHDMHKTLDINATYTKENQNNVYRKKLRHFMKVTCITDPTRRRLCFNNKGEIPERLKIFNCINRIHHDNVGGKAIEGHVKIVGAFNESLPPDQQLKISSSDINWINNKMPYSRCSETCLPGFRKSMIEGYHICCYDCVPCNEGEISNTSDAENCQMCFYTEWPNETRDKCLPKVVDFLSYETDVVVYVFLFFSVFSSIVIVIIIGIFIIFWNTPVVRANNHILSFVILISVKLSLLCIVLFIGKPMDTTCMLRHISFGIFFTVVLSSVLAKTIMVCIAFKATTPGNSWRKWIGVKLSNYLVVTLSSVQVLNGILWLTFSPPFQEIDMDSYPGKIIIQCNEGSKLAFYFMLGYMGFLAAVSLILAFMVRTLPDIYNEAKYITFSMLVFCSVWICAIPVYLSSKGKSLVSVEVFAILSSGDGIVLCMFLPKLWNIVTKPELKTRPSLQK